MVHLLGILLTASIKINGIVVDKETRKPIPYAAIEVENLKRGTYAEEDGKFILELPDTGIYVFKITALGFEPKRIKLRLLHSRKLTIALRQEAIRLEEIVVTPGAHAVEEEVGPGKGTMSHMDIVMMPGAATDPMWALQTIPGVGGGTDRATMAIQGGDPSELAVYVNGLRVPHPYHYEDEKGGLFSFIRENIIQRASLYSAGYPATYGNALSGILDLQTKKGGIGGERSIEMSMAGVGLTLTGNSYALFVSRSYTELLKFFFSDSNDVYTIYPRTFDLQGVWGTNIGKKSYFSVFGITGWDAVGVDLSKEDFPGEFRDHSFKGVGGMQFSTVLGKWSFKLSAGVNGYRNDISVGEPWSWKMREFGLEMRFVAERKVSRRIFVQAGFDLWRVNSDFDAIYPEDSLEWRDPDAKKDTLTRNLRFLNFGSFAIARIALTPKVFLEAGLRGDYFGYNSSVSLDPRFAIAYIDSGIKVRLGGGVYHQPSSSTYLDSVLGNPDLPRMQAYHGVFSVEKSINSSFSLEGQVFYKRYSNLPVEKGDSYEALGKGRSYGAQLLLRKYTGRITGWIAYTYLRSFRAADSTLREYRSDYDTPNILAVVVQAYLGKGFNIGAKLRYSTGRPYTPVVDAYYVEDGDYWVPVYGEHNSARYPDYLRLDIRLTRITQIRGHAYVFFLELINVTNRKNVVGWRYSRDYSEKKPLMFFSLMPVGGFVLYF